MKSERGVTLTSIMIYIVALTIVVAIVARVSTYFYKNVNTLTSNTSADAEYTKFNSYFTNEINIKDNTVLLCGEDGADTTEDTEDDQKYIIFSKTQNQYTFKGNGIYVNRIKICKDIDSCTFSYDSENDIITVDMVIKGKTYNNQYTIVR